MSNKSNYPRVYRGFTLLEVMIALTITAMVMGGLFTLSAGSKQLAFRAQQSLQDSTAARAAVNEALLDNEFRDLEPAMASDRYTIEGMDVLPDAERRTAPMTDVRRPGAHPCLRSLHNRRHGCAPGRRTSNSADDRPAAIV